MLVLILELIGSILIFVPSKVTHGGDPMCGACPSKVFHMRLFESGKNVIKLVYQGILALHLLFMHLKPLVMVVEALLVAFVSGFEPLESGFNYRIDGAALVNRTDVVRLSCHLSICLLTLRGQRCCWAMVTVGLPSQALGLVAFGGPSWPREEVVIPWG